ncbi:nuclear transport factor 2 family protein [Janthinobacterium sp. BJB301]|uniref:nuclear transport factor 2 family protein n=1 Tax=Janthinobacterium sp. BJB301 TaxID=1560195 RepID=UPI0015D4E24C|nr:nuclear transport factor 2 family protein [Janthinobacterium sp. BJB301]
MSLLMPAIVGDYLTAENHHDSDAVAQCFAADGAVHDDGHAYAGHAAIKAWKEAGSKQYGATVSPTSADTRGARCVVTSSVSGNFPGSPLELRFAFTLASNRIQTLEISA